MDNGGQRVLQPESRISGLSVLAGDEGVYGQASAGFLVVFIWKYLDLVERAA